TAPKVVKPKAATVPKALPSFDAVGIAGDDAPFSTDGSFVGVVSSVATASPSVLTGLVRFVQTDGLIGFERVNTPNTEPAVKRPTGAAAVATKERSADP